MTTEQPTTTTSYFIESRPAGTDEPWRQTGLQFSWQDPSKSDEKLAWARRQQPEREHRLVTRTTVVTEQPTEAPGSLVPAGFPTVQGRCPACGMTGLFVGSGGYVTCSHFECPEPDAASTVLEHRYDELRRKADEAQQAGEGR